MQPAILILSPLKSLVEFYAQKRRVHELACALAERPGLEGDLSTRLYYLCLLTEKLERMMVPQLAAAGRCVDVALSQAAAEWLYDLRQRQGVTAIRPTTPKALREDTRYQYQVERDWLALAAINAKTDRTQLVVVGEHTFGYIHPLQPDRAGILHASILRGATSGFHDGYVLLSGRSVRLATVEDFDTYRIQRGSFLTDPEYVYQH
jgi:hypothetical protein